MRAFSSSRKAAIVWYRSRGALAIARSRIGWRAGRARGFRSVIGRGVALITAFRTSTAWRPRKGATPVTIS